MEDPLFYFVGRFYPHRAETHLARYFPDVARAADRCRAWFRRFATLAVFVEPGAAVCLMAGASRMSPTWFALVNVAGTVSRVGAVRAAGVAASGWTNAAANAATRFRTTATAATVAVAVAALAPLVRRVYRETLASTTVDEDDADARLSSTSMRLRRSDARRTVIASIIPS